MKNTEVRIQKSEYRMRKSECGSRKSEYRMRNGNGTRISTDLTDLHGLFDNSLIDDR